MSVREGASIGAYRLLERIGRGGMATVYRAYHPALDRNVAIKVLPEFFAEDPEYRERFQHEAQSIARLRHPNILEVFDFGSEEGVAYIVMELVEGGSLADHLGSPMPLDRALSYLEPLVVALTAHAMAGDRERAIEAGCEGYVSKPIDTRMFGGQVRKFLADSRQAAAS